MTFSISSSKKAEILPNSKTNDLISIVIPCYNHAKYLPDAIDSILTQEYKEVEIIVVDDGSIDDTRNIAQQYGQVKYIYQKNQGLSAARNTGIDHSTGNYLVFLDADDWLLPDALTINLQCLKNNQNLAFVSGGYVALNIIKGERIERFVAVENNHYQKFLQGNYIGMHATVMYQRWVFNEFRFDTSLKASEDYDIYMKISRKYPVKHHSKFIAVYRFHDSNMSGNIALMLNYTLKVLKRQKDFLLNKEEKKIYKKGIRIWEDYYSQQLVNAFQPKPACPPKKEMLNEHFISLWHHKKLYYLYLKYRITMSVQKSRKGIKSLIRHNSPLFMQRWMYRNGLTKKFTPLPGHIELGDLNRVTPISTEFGYNRGGPVDRYYIENFLKDESAKINGRVLEIGDNEYTLMFGGKKVTKSDILHITEDNPKATYIGDLSNAPQLPSNSFDCIVLTQTLHLIYNFKGALETCYRVLKQGGSLLLTVPGISHIDHGEWGKNWMWSFTESSIKKALSEVFEVEKTNVQTFGNVLVATAFLYGLGLPELKKEQMDYNDPRYQVIITAVATK